jgi:hypothetical protein
MPRAAQMERFRESANFDMIGAFTILSRLQRFIMAPCLIGGVFRLV